MSWLPLVGAGGLTGAIGGVIVGPFLELTDAQTTVFGGMVTAFITSAAAVAIAYINRPARHRNRNRTTDKDGDPGTERATQTESQGDHDDEA